jgi:FkbM family methyltransferase
MTTTGESMELTERLDRLVDAVRQMDGAVESLILNETAVLDGLAQMLGAVHQLQNRNEETLKKLSDQIHQFGLDLAAQMGARNPRQPIVVAASEYQAQNPETGLLRHLYSFLPEPVAVDVGAHHGEIARHLLDAGYSVVAFEPFPASFAELESELLQHPNLRAHPWAVGEVDRTGNLHLASDAGDRGGDVSLFHTLAPHSADANLRFAESVSVPVRSLGSLVNAGVIPGRIGLLKIDTEGSDLDVIRGMGSLRAAAVMAEFWDAEHEFARSGRGRLADLVSEMRTRGYRWHLVIYHIDHKNVISYYQNRSDTIPHSWGNVVFFEHQGLLQEALAWVNDVLPPTRFR